MKNVCPFYYYCVDEKTMHAPVFSEVRILVTNNELYMCTRESKFILFVAQVHKIFICYYLRSKL